MGSGDMIEQPLAEKAAIAVREELERQAAENPSRLRVRRKGADIEVEGEIDIDALVMVVVGSMAGGP